MSFGRQWISLSLAACMLSASGCGDDKKSSKTEQESADAALPMTSDAEVPYQGPVRGGVVPDAPEYEEPAPDNGPFDANIPCCDQTLSFVALAGETAAVIEADSAPLDGAVATLDAGVFTLALCMPTGVAVNYRLKVTAGSDEGPVERVRVDGEEPSFEDADGASWNVFAQEACE